MNQVKLVYGSVRNRKFATPAKQAELKQQVERLETEWLTVEEEGPLSVSDVLMSVGMYIGMPIMLVGSIASAILV